MLCFRPSQPHHPPPAAPGTHRGLCPTPSGPALGSARGTPGWRKPEDGEAISSSAQPRSELSAPVCDSPRGAHRAGARSRPQGREEPRDALERPEAPFVTGGVKPGPVPASPGLPWERSLGTAGMGRGTEYPHHFVFSGPVHERRF